MQTGISISYGKSVLVLLYLIQYMVLLRNYATLNINCLQSKNKQSLLNAFIRQNSIDILLLQEVNTENFDFIGPQYDYVVNTGDENRGTAVIYRCGLTVDAIEKHPSGRVIAMKINNIQVLNVYLPSGTNHRQQRESFLSKELPFFLRHRYDCLLIGGDWNCVLHAKDQTGQYNPSPVLANLTQDLHLVDTWELLHVAEILNIKSTICALQQKFMDGVKIRARTPTVSEDERCALYHLVKEKRNARTKYISHLQTTEGTQLTSNSDCIKEIETFFRALYSASPTSATETDTLLKHVNRHLNLQQQRDLQLPITEEEILRAIETAPKNSAPGPDGLTYQLYKMQWNLIKDTLVDLFNYIFDRGIVVEGFSDGIVILLPKVTNPRTVSEYRPITLLNTDYKLFMKILACRVKTTFRDIIEIGQTCSVPDKSIIHNLATIRDSILYYEEFPDEKQHCYQ
ncbi:hypothetical protein ANN_08414 [Periplaneta americana]|uniref:Endonuclease/exonuclease/phosphatase domain-containing protein n=1 Tax=Periplaneta americana TaxID=6978 RepID=A0ABQ8T1D2_PERAM|nr:hypothetical protein ANN_08414 [Periplaneta americana]